MGGGFPVSYNLDDESPKLSSYINKAKINHPRLFTNNFVLITEFGRYVHANAAWVISQVEYVIEESSYKIISVHIGADLLLRKAYHPIDWHHEITILDKYGRIKDGLDPKKYIVAGPLCFAGDILATDIQLPIVQVGDYLVVHDIGAYTLSMWSRYNSRQIPKTIGYSIKDGIFEVLKKRESLEDLYDF